MIKKCSHGGRGGSGNDIFSPCCVVYINLPYYSLFLLLFSYSQQQTCPLPLHTTQHPLFREIIVYVYIVCLWCVYAFVYVCIYIIYTRHTVMKRACRDRGDVFRAWVG
jgi:hypothetical protein